MAANARVVRADPRHLFDGAGGSVDIGGEHGPPASRPAVFSISLLDVNVRLIP
jgi:hypothetical protein